MYFRLFVIRKSYFKRIIYHTLHNSHVLIQHSLGGREQQQAADVGSRRSSSYS